MKLLFQPENSSTCGQHCVAMIAGISVAKSIALFNSKGCTSTKKVAAALRKLGFPAKEKLIRFKTQKDLPKVCILKLRWPASGTGHWVVYNRGTIYDSVYGKYLFAEEKFAELGVNPRFYLQVTA